MLGTALDTGKNLSKKSCGTRYAESNSRVLPVPARLQALGAIKCVVTLEY